MRMAANHLVVNFADDVSRGEAALLARNLRMKNHLKKKIAHFLGEFGVIAGIESVQNFVSFFDQVRTKSGVRLFAVPRTALRSAQAFLYGDEFFKPIAGS